MPRHSPGRRRVPRSRGEVDLDSKLVGRTITTGDHNGYAVVIMLS